MYNRYIYIIDVVMVTYFKEVPLIDLTALILSIMVDVKMDVSL